MTDISKRRDYFDSVIVQHGIASMPVEKFDVLAAERDAATERYRKLTHKFDAVTRHGMVLEANLAAAIKRAEKAEAQLIAGSITERYPTMYADEAACRAIEKHRARVAAMEGALEMLVSACDAHNAANGREMVCRHSLAEARAALSAPPAPTVFDLIAHIHRQRDFSARTFGPGARTAGVCDHIRKELREIEAAPADITEWADVILLALDGAWRSGAAPEEIAAAIKAKQAKNEARMWPDWRTADPNKAIEHDRRYDAPAPSQAAADVLAERLDRQSGEG